METKNKIIRFSDYVEIYKGMKKKEKPEVPYLFAYKPSDFCNKLN